MKHRGSSVKTTCRSGRAKMFLQFSLGTVTCDRLAPEKVLQRGLLLFLCFPHKLLLLFPLYLPSTVFQCQPIAIPPSCIFFLGHSIKCLDCKKWVIWEPISHLFKMRGKNSIHCPLLQLGVHLALLQSWASWQLRPLGFTGGNVAAVSTCDICRFYRDQYFQILRCAASINLP